jgi:hypothetical protein
MESFQVFLIALAVVAAVVLAVWLAKLHAERERKRREELARFATQNGMQFSQSDRWNLDTRYRGVGEIGRGHKRYAFDVVRLDQPPLAVFQYHFKTWETRTVRRGKRTVTQRYEKTHWRKYLVAELGAPFPRFTLRPEGWLDKVAGFVGFDDIDFESEQFSSRYHCKSDSKEFAYALIHPQMMEYLMDLGVQFQIESGLLVMDLAGYPFTAVGVQAAMAKAAGFINRIPDFAWQDYAHCSPLKLPEPAYCPPPPQHVSPGV